MFKMPPYPKDDEMRELTDRQQQVLNAIRRRIYNSGVPPTRRELAEDINVKAGPSVEGHLQALQRRGLIELVPDTQRGIKLCGDAGLPAIGTVYTRQPDKPLFDEDEVFDRIPELMAGAFEPRATFFMMLSHQGMEIHGLRGGDIVGVRETDQAEDGQAIIARRSTRILCRFFRRIDRRHVRLSRYENHEVIHEIVDTFEEDFRIEGIVVGALVGLRDFELPDDTDT